MIITPIPEKIPDTLTIKDYYSGEVLKVYDLSNGLSESDREELNQFLLDNPFNISIEVE